MSRPPTLLRYWGSHFKSPDQVRRVAVSFFAAPLIAGWRCHLVCSQPPANTTWLAPLLDAGITLHYLPRARGNFDPACVLRAWRLCRQLAVDVFHCDNTHTSPLIGAWLARVPARFWSKRAMQPAFEQMRAPTLRDRLAPAVRVSAAACTEVHPLSTNIADELAALGISRRKLRVIHNPVMFSTDSARARDAARRRWALQPGHLVFGTVGRSLPVKGWDVLLEAFATTHCEFPESRLLLVGSTASDEERQFRARLDTIIDAAGIREAVIFTGHLTNVSEGFAAMNAFVLPSHSEGCSLALIEALAASLPVVATRVGSAPDILTDGVHGLLVERNNVAALARSLRVLAGNPLLRRQLAAAAPQALGALPSPEQYAQALFTVYDSLLSRHGRSTAS